MVRIGAIFSERERKHLSARSYQFEELGSYRWMVTSTSCTPATHDITHSFPIMHTYSDMSDVCIIGKEQEEQELASAARVHSLLI